MPKLRVLIADDSVVVRRLVNEILTADSELEVIGTAANGKIAVAKAEQLVPDVVILDVEMPDMDGLEALSLIRSIFPMMPVIMFSTLTERGATATLEALSLGANDYVSKPANVGGVTESITKLRDELIPKIKLFCHKQKYPEENEKAAVHSAKHLPATRQLLSNKSLISREIHAIGIGVSTGGPNALTELLPRLPADFEIPVFVVQHMPAVFTRLLAERLAAKCLVKVKEAEDGEVASAGTVYIAPGDYHMVVERMGGKVIIQNIKTQPVNSCRPSVDPLFESLAAVYGGNLMVAVLTGMGQDGMYGCDHVRESGGFVVVQDEESSVVWGMPGAVFRRGLADKIMNLERLAFEIISRSKSKKIQVA